MVVDGPNNRDPKPLDFILFFVFFFSTASARPWSVEASITAANSSTDARRERRRQACLLSACMARGSRLDFEIAS